jgi:hypothetical protein
MKKLIPIFIVIFAFSTFGQTFSKGWQKVPATFTGSDFQNIYSTLLRTPVIKDKGEFETTDQYNQRISDLSKIVFSSKETASDELVFVFRPEKDLSILNDDLSSSYDADEETLTISLKPTKVAAYESKPGNKAVGAKQLDFESFIAKSGSYKDEGEYVASNAFGATRKVEKSSFRRFKLAINNINQFSNFKASTYSSEFKVRLYLPLPKAKEAKENLSVLYIAKLVKPFYTIDSYKIKPTIDKPSDLDFTSVVLISDVREIWFFNGLTGEIYTKLSAK